jgi:hypothetical protein
LSGALPFSRVIFRVVIAVIAMTPASGQEYPSMEDQVKAVYLYNFAKFIEWPADTFPSAKNAFRLCIYGYNPFGSALDELVQGKTLNNRQLEVRRIIEPAELKACQMVFIDEKESTRLPEILKNLAGTSALVVGESEGFAERGGAVEFFLEDKKLRFSFNVDALQRARLQASSKLLALARIVHDKGDAKGGAK